MSPIGPYRAKMSLPTISKRHDFHAIVKVQIRSLGKEEWIKDVQMDIISRTIPSGQEDKRG